MELNIPTRFISEKLVFFFFFFPILAQFQQHILIEISTKCRWYTLIKLVFFGGSLGFFCVFFLEFFRHYFQPFY